MEEEGEVVDGEREVWWRWWRNLLLSLVVGGRRKKKICSIEKEGSTVATLPLVRIWVGGDDGGQAGGNCDGGRRPRRREKEERELAAEEELEKEGSWFFSIFAPDFLHAQAMKSTLFIGDGRGQSCLVYTGENFRPLIRLRRILTVGLK